LVPFRSSFCSPSYCCYTRCSHCCCYCRVFACAACLGYDNALKTQNINTLTPSFLSGCRKQTQHNTHTPRQTERKEERQGQSAWQLGHVTLSIRTVCFSHYYRPCRINKQTKQLAKQLKLSSRRLKLVLINFIGHMLNLTCGDFSTWSANFQVVVG